MHGGLSITKDEQSCTDVCLLLTFRPSRANQIIVEEKYGTLKASSLRKTDHRTTEDSEGSSDSSSDEEEDDNGILASGTLDQEVNATLRALRNKDPRVYDANASFYTTQPEDWSEMQGMERPREQKAMYLSDYHRENLLKGNDEMEDNPIPTYAREQEALKSNLVKEIHAAAEVSEESDDGQSNDFLVKKPLTEDNGVQGSRANKAITTEDVEAADNDPEGYLDKFISARAWVSTENSKLHPFESDDDEEENFAEGYEQAYNLRFEDPEASNEKLMTYARDIVARNSLRKPETNKRKRAREAEQTRRDEAKQERTQEKALLRKLKLEEVEEKIQKIKEAAGYHVGPVKVEEWANFLVEDWDDDGWEKEMQKKFGQQYYAAEEVSKDSEMNPSKNMKIKKPKWDEDIDITDLVPDFTNEQEHVSLSDASDAESTSNTANAQSTRHGKAQARQETKRERRKIQQLVDEKVDLEMALDRRGTNRSEASRFRYRETSPMTFGLTSQDILMATDSQLNQFAGLKKLAAFRDTEKKRKDRKQLSKKARLRMWRQETFGDQKGSQKTLQDVLRAGQASDSVGALENQGDIAGTERKKRRKKSKSGKGVSIAESS